MKTPRYPLGITRSGFTLIELLVVIAIIGVLAGILIPVIGRVRASGNTTRCAANMRQIGLQLMAYANENRGVTIRSYDADNDVTWQKALALHDGTYAHLTKPKQVGKDTDYGIWRCPENMEQMKAVSGGGDEGEAECSYGINGWADSTEGTRYTGSRVSSFTNPSKLYMLTEACYFRLEPEKTDGKNTIPAGLYTSGPSFLRYAHSGKINMVYADGHMELLTGPLLGRGTGTGPAGSTPAVRLSNGVHWYAF